MVSASIVNSTRQSPTRNRISHAFERLYVAGTGFGKCNQFEVDLRTRSGRQLAPLAGGGRRKCDLLHVATIA
jgi:hypothetical protein